MTTEIKFEHSKHGLSSFFYELNDLNGKMMYWFSYSNSMFSGSMRDVKQIIVGIEKNHKKV